MKRIIPYLLLLLFAVTTNGFAQSWIDQLKTFRDAVYQRDKETAKQFFNFPLSNLDGGFWYSATEDAKGDTYNHLVRLAEKNYPLTEQLFDLYFDQIFNKKFITSFLKLKTKELHEKGGTKTMELSTDNVHFYHMNADYDASSATLTLRIFGHSTEKDENGELLDNGGEYCYSYQFVIKNGRLKFAAFFMAG